MWLIALIVGFVSVVIDMTFDLLIRNNTHNAFKSLTHTVHPREMRRWQDVTQPKTILRLHFSSCGGKQRLRQHFFKMSFQSSYIH